MHSQKYIPDAPAGQRDFNNIFVGRENVFDRDGLLFTKHTTPTVWQNVEISLYELFGDTFPQISTIVSMLAS